MVEMCGVVMVKSEGIDNYIYTVPVSGSSAVEGL